jgi:benzoate/toluate 1,2-dioxygenase beta subunit/2,4,5-trichlorophenoxyacetic acid oxygenase 2
VAPAEAFAAGVILREALALDECRWDDWLALFAVDSVFWVPAWRDERTLTEDPDREISFLYHDSRAGLAERVARLRTEQSVITMPMPRTSHLVGQPVFGPGTNDLVRVTSPFITNVYHPATGKLSVACGRYEHELRRTGDDWCIVRKKIILVNDRIPGMLEYFCL